MTVPGIFPLPPPLYIGAVRVVWVLKAVAYCHLAAVYGTCCSTGVIRPFPLPNKTKRDTSAHIYPVCTTFLRDWLNCSRSYWKWEERKTTEYREREKNVSLSTTKPTERDNTVRGQRFRPTPFLFFSFLILKNGKKNANHNTKTLALLIKCRTFRLQREPVFRFLRQDNPFSKRWEIKEKNKIFRRLMAHFSKTLGLHRVGEREEGFLFPVLDSFDLASFCFFDAKFFQRY